MGRSIPTDEPAVTYPSLIADTSLRLQHLVNGWRCAERGEPNMALPGLKQVMCYRDSGRLMWSATL
jgi:hypothetical protein